jgi:hypothetical protein
MLAVAERRRGASVKYLTRLMRKLVLQYGGDWAEHLYEALIVVRIL